MKIGIVGGGILGLTLGYYLQKQGHQVHIYESNSYIGGLACSFDYGRFIWDKFYHVIMSHDHHLLELLYEIGLSKYLRWQDAGVGYFSDGKFYSMSNFRQMLRFPLLNWLDKARMSLAVLYSIVLARPGSLYNQTAKEWLIKIFGKSNYINFWKPLLRAKFGDYAEKVAAVFIWASLKRLLGGRFDRRIQGTTGYVQGGYHRILAALKYHLESSGSCIFVRTNINWIGLASELSQNPIDYNKKIKNNCASNSKKAFILNKQEKLLKGNEKYNMNQCLIKYSINNGGYETNWYDKVIFTAPKQFALKVISTKIREQIENKTKQKNEHQKYLGVVCLNVVLRHHLIPYYLLNIDEETIPLTGMVEMTNLINASVETHGHTLVYLPRYLDSMDPFLYKEDEYIYKELFDKGLKKLFPNLSNDDVISWHVQKASQVQPLTLISEKSPSLENRIPNMDYPFALVNSSHLACPTLNNNEIVGLAKQIALVLNSKFDFKI